METNHLSNHFRAIGSVLGIFALLLNLQGQQSKFDGNSSNSSLNDDDRLTGSSTSITVDVDKPVHSISPMLWGIFFEDINLSADGGIYPEMVRNRSFEDSEKPDYWSLLNQGNAKSTLSIDNSMPLNPFNRNSLLVSIKDTTSLINYGYFGMAFAKGESYQVKLAARIAEGFNGPLTISFENNQGKILSKGEITGFTDKWKYFTLDLTPSVSDTNGRLNITFNHEGKVWLDMVSVMPKKTWKNHGLRPDICEMLANLKPSFLRFPGGCWVEGNDMAHMYHWKETIGDIDQRKPKWNIWGYWATQGLGYHEYLQLSEDLGAEPLFCINAGMSHGENVPMDQMGQWVQDALDAIEYANAPANTIWGGLRAANGHPEPFNLKYIEIGNENSGPAYQERYALFYDAIKARYPQVILIANEEPTVSRPSEVVDIHHYSIRESFMHADWVHHYDNLPRNGPKIFIGEYAVNSGSGQPGTMGGAIGEAAFMTGMERNSDLVIMSSYAPLLVNVQNKRWPTNLINFDNSRIYGIPSYYIQKMFSENKGNVVLPVKVKTSDIKQTVDKSGKIGVGTHYTKAEYKDIKVTCNEKTLFKSDFTDNPELGVDKNVSWLSMSSWQFGAGEWKVRNGALFQNSLAGSWNLCAWAGDSSWQNYTYTLKARKIEGNEGFQIYFLGYDVSTNYCWNIGGDGNTYFAIEDQCGTISNKVPGYIDADRWYNIRVEMSDTSIKCFLDDKLIHDIRYPAIKAIYASSSLDKSSNEVILKVVNVGNEPKETILNLNGVTVNNSARVTVLTSANPEDENSMDNPTRVLPATRMLENVSNRFQYIFPGNSLTIIRFKKTQ